MKIYKLLILAFTSALPALAQSMSIYQGGEPSTFNLNEIDSITFDNTPNLWQDAVKTVSFYYAPGWNKIADPKHTESNGTHSLTYNTATSAQWQAQTFFATDIATDAHNNYNFRIRLRSNKSVTATVKLYQNGNDNLYYFEERVPLTANEDVSFTRSDMPGLDISRINLLVDIGGNAAGTVLTVSGISLTNAHYDSSVNRNSCPLEGYKLIWYDEFPGTSLNTTKWTYQTAEAGWVNHELQTYVNAGSPKGQKVAEVSDGTLKIRTFKEGDKVYSGRIYGRKTTGFKYGYIEARIKLPKGKGTWPAWWMMPVSGGSWPACGEIDIMEEVGVDANIVSSSIHCTAYNHPNKTQKTHSSTCIGAEDGFHVYALEWTEDYIRTFVDGKEQLYFENDKQGNNDTWPFNKSFYPILNVAWGGDWGGYAGVDEAALPLTMEVDYVRVWQKR